MISILDVIYAAIKKFKVCVPDSKHYFNLPEDYNTPSFLYNIVFNKASRKTKYVKDVSLDLQIILFSNKDELGKEDYEGKIQIAEQLRSFLDTFILQVGDRYLKFDYSFGEADEQLTINMNFKFKDGVINLEESYELMQHLYINREEV
ncbi:MAG: hypothetical protein E6590_09985 [Clostridiales bacterium]|uniref:hypothetical protein n=1 Tax=Zhenhengia sp. TaxID=2944208 RepID=UPI002910AE09|nr:hypothetical protein [Clostridiales bacterium]